MIFNNMYKFKPIDYTICWYFDTEIDISKNKGCCNKKLVNKECEIHGKNIHYDTSVVVKFIKNALDIYNKCYQDINVNKTCRAENVIQIMISVSKILPFIYEHRNFNDVFFEKFHELLAEPTIFNNNVLYDKLENLYNSIYI